MPRLCVDHARGRRASPAACGGARQFGSQNFRIHPLADASASTICLPREAVASDGASRLDASVACGKASAFVAELFHRDAGVAGAQRVGAQAQRRNGSGSRAIQGTGEKATLDQLKLRSMSTAIRSIVGENSDGHNVDIAIATVLNAGRHHIREFIEKSEPV